MLTILLEDLAVFLVDIWDTAVGVAQWVARGVQGLIAAVQATVAATKAGVTAAVNAALAVKTFCVEVRLAF